MIAVTVLLSVIAHGVTAAPLAARYGRAAAPSRPGDKEVHPEIPLRGLPRRRGGATGPDRFSPT